MEECAVSDVEELSVHLRAFTEPAETETAETEADADSDPGSTAIDDKSTKTARRGRSRRAGWMPPPGEREVLIFDCETSTDTTQALTFGVWRLCREVVDSDGQFVRLAVREEGILHADDLTERDPDGYAVLVEHVNTYKPGIDPDRHSVEPAMQCALGIVLESREWFCEERIYKSAYKRKAPVVGFNLPFDLSRISVGWRRARGKRWGGGFALVLRNYTDRSDPRKPVEKPHPYRPTVNVKPIDGRRALLGFGSRQRPDPEDADADGKPYAGEFIDLQALVLGLTGEKHSLASACRAMRAAELKSTTAEHGSITHEYIEYARQDVAATQALYEACRRELDRHPIDVPAHRILSSAGIGKGYMRAMRVSPRLELQPDFPRDVLGAAASSYYGGRVEAHLLGSVPVRYLDVLSMYPTVNTLMQLWELVIAARVQAREATSEVRDLLSRVSLADVMRPDDWPGFVGIAQLAEIDGENHPILPLRAVYGHGSVPTIAVNALAARHDGWYAIPDLIASTLLTGHAPKIARAVIFDADGRQDTAAVKLRGEISIDPAQRDLFAALIEERQRIKRHRTDGKTDAWRAQALKIIANSTSYGINMEMLRDEAPTSRPVDLIVHTGQGAFQTLSLTPESPRHYCFPPIATLITAGARLILAAVEAQIREAGGTIAYMDTDSVAVVSTRHGGLTPCTGGDERTPDGTAAIRALSHTTVDEIAERFAALNPYDPEIAGGSILELEAENHTQADGEGDQLYLYVLGSKRYAMYRIADDGRVIVQKYSEHGLGLRLDPTDPTAPVTTADDDIGTASTTSERHGRRWIGELWRYLIETDALGRDVAEPVWFDRPALCKLTITRPYIAQRLKLAPFNFILTAQIKSWQKVGEEEQNTLRLIAPFESDPRAWTRMPWTDAYTGTRYKITTGNIDGTVTDRVYVKSYRDIAQEFKAHPEAKLARTDGQTAKRRYRGLLARRKIAAGETIHIGKEGNHIDEIEAGLLRADEAISRYAPPSIRAKNFAEHVRPVIKTFTVEEIARATSIPARTIERIRAGNTPQIDHEKLLTQWAVSAARKALKDAGRTLPADRRAALRAWRALPEDQRSGMTPVCEGCGKALPRGRRRYHSSACESKARRRRASTGKGDNEPASQQRNSRSIRQRKQKN
jgi:hypothetical protein